MKNRRRFIHFVLIVSLMAFVNVNSQSLPDSTTVESFTNEYSNEILKGLVLDAKDQSPLPYTNIYLLNKNKGVVSNEKGHFSINIANCKETDTLRISYIGYKTKDLTIEELKISSIVSLKEDNLMLNNITVFGSAPDPKTIVKKVIENKAENYGETSCKKQVFLRNREVSDVNQINFNCKKSSFSNLNAELIELLEKEIPKHTISYTDFLADVFILKQENDSFALKIDPIKIIELEEKTDLTKLGELAETFKDVLNNTGNNEYWKIKTGIIGSKVNVDENSVSIGTEGEKTDSLSNEDRDPLHFQKWSIKDIASYSSLDDEDEWEFLYSTSKYQYTLYGATVANGEEVYIIDFEPNNRGVFVGRMYVSMNTYALIRVDYEYFPERMGRDIQLLGMGFSENKFSASLYFEKKEERYQLKYCSKIEGYNYSFDRAVSLLKKKERFLFDKKLDEIKVGIDFSGATESSVEILVLEEEPISQDLFNNFEENNNIEIIYVDQFNEDLWKGYSVIEPTKQMKDYKKLK